MNVKPCERCNIAPRVIGERFCADCKKIVKAEMIESGYMPSDHELRRSCMPPGRGKGYKAQPHRFEADDWSKEEDAQ